MTIYDENEMVFFEENEREHDRGWKLWLKTVDEKDVEMSFPESEKLISQRLTKSSDELNTP